MSKNENRLLGLCQEGPDNKYKEVRVLLASGDVDVNCTGPNRWTPLHHACFNNMPKIVDELLKKGADVHRKDSQDNTPLHYACISSNIKIVKALLKKNANIQSKNYQDVTPLEFACMHDNTKVVELLLDKVDDIDLDRLLHGACFYKQVDNVVPLLKMGVDISKKDKRGQTPFHVSCRQGDLKTVQFLWKHGAAAVLNDADNNGQTPLHKACMTGDLKTVQFLLKQGAAAVLNQADNNGKTPLAYACEYGRLAVVKLLCADEDIVVDAHSFGYMEHHQREFSKQVDKIAKDYLSDLTQTINGFEADNPDGIFDFPIDEAGHRNTEQSLLGYYVLRHLIRCSEANEYSQLANEMEISSHIERLLNIPSIKALVVANAQSIDLPEIYLRPGNRQFARQKNELLRLAQNIGNEAIAARLLGIPEIREAAQDNDFYQGPDGIDLAEVARDHESSMRALTPQEQERVKAIEDAYQATIKAQGGVSEVIKQLKETLKAKYLANQADRTITLNEIDYSLPFEWNELQKLIKDNDFTEEQQEVILQGYYQNPYHTAYRYLSKPNHWMSEHAGWVRVNPITGARWSTFEEYLPFIAYLWTAANDEARLPVEANVSVADRVDLFIRQIAFINRAHNWDDYRDVLDAEENVVVDAHGNPLREEYDDLEKDKPSCFSGVKKRLFQALLHHPLYTPLDKAIVTQFVNESVRAYFRGLLLSYPVERLETIDRAIGDYFVFLGDEEDDDNTYPRNKALVDALMLPDGFADTVKERLAAQYGPKTAMIFASLIDELVAPEKPLVANDFLRFYNSAALEQLLEQTLLLAPVTQHLQPLIDIAAVNYLFTQAKPETKADFDAFNALVRNVQQYGVSRIWEAIEENVKENYLALEGVDATEANWQELSPQLQTLHLTQEANNLIHDELFRVARNSVGYRAYSKQGGEGGSRSSFWTAPEEKREVQWTLWDCVKAAAIEHDRASTSDPARKGEVAESIKEWWQLDEAALAKEVYQYLKKGHGGWSKNSFKAQLGWHVFNKLDGKGLKGKQAGILNEAPINGGNIRHHCNYFWSASHREDALNQLLRAFSAEFHGSDVVPMPRQRAGLI